MNSRELQKIEKILMDLDEVSDKLTDWEKRFVSDNLERLEKYGMKTFFTDKQAERVHKMEEEYL